MKKFTRLFIYPNDIAIITGRSNRYGRTILKKMKMHFGKQPHQLITIKECAEYFGLDPKEIYITLGLIK